MYREKIIIFGASSCGEEALKDLKEIYDVLFFADNDFNKCGTFVQGIEVIHPSKLKEYNNILIVIASIYYKEIISQLYDLGIRNYKIYNYFKRHSVNLENLFSNKFYYKKEKAILIKEDKNDKEINKILFIQTSKFNSTMNIIKALNSKNIKVDLLLLDNVQIENKTKLFNNIFTLNNFHEHLFCHYDIIHNSNEDREINKFFIYSKLPVVTYLSNELYINENIFFDDRILDIIECKVKNIEQCFIEPSKGIEYFDLKENVALSLNYNVFYEDKKEINYNEIKKYNDYDNEIHCAFIEDMITDYEYINKNIDELAKNKIHVHIFSKGNNSKIQTKYNRYIHKTNINDNINLVGELRKCDVGLIFSYLNINNDLFLANIIPDFIWELIQAGLPIGIEKVHNIEELVVSNKIGNVLNFEYNLREQIEKVKEITYDNKSILYRYGIEKYFSELLDFYRNVKAYCGIETEKKNIKEKNEITILIPTRNRFNFLKRTVSYFDLMNSNELMVKIYILDSSDDALSEQIEKYFQKLNKNNIKYYKYNSDTKLIEKLLLGAKQIKTKICAVCADDDFLSKTYIIKSIEEIERGYDITYGSNLYIDLDEYEFFSSYLEDYNQICKKHINVEQKLIEYIQNMPQLFYRVFKTNSLLDFLCKINSHIYYSLNLNFQEYIYYFALICKYKIKKIEDLSYICTSNKKQWSKFGENFYDSVMDNTFNANCKKCEQILQQSFLKENEYINFMKIMEKLLYKLDINRKYINLKTEGFDLDLLKVGFEKSQYWGNKINVRENIMKTIF